MLNSIQIEDVVEVRVELGKKLSFLAIHFFCRSTEGVNELVFLEVKLGFSSYF